ncbi:MAG: hypothetical protein MUF04_09545 [Akkermansiaceae bacterium]|jgi:hypothetical protein|nr:hypothetical protein [Akkermansiaceae bacterium]
MRTNREKQFSEAVFSLKTETDDQSPIPTNQPTIEQNKIEQNNTKS